MQKQLYKVGDRVRLVIDQDDEYVWLKAGSLGTVCKVGQQVPGGSGNYLVWINWDRHVGGHSCGGLCPHGYGWNVFQYEIEYAESICGEIGEPADADSLLSLLYREV